jgi:phage terminase large subunit
VIEWEFPQKLGFLFKPSRYKIAYGGRGGAKSWGFARALLLLAAEKPLRIVCMREVQKSIKESVYELLRQQIAELGLESCYPPTSAKNPTDIVAVNGSKFVFAGLSDLTATSIKSFEGFDICWVEEAQAVTRRSWDILTPTIRKDDSEIWITLNPELDDDETWKRFVLNPPPNAVVVEINHSDNPFLPQVLKDERKEFLRLVEIGQRDRDDYENIWEGKTKAALPGSIYQKEVIATKMAKRLCPVPYDPMLKVHTIWDLGWADFMSVLCVQKQASQIRIIRYIEDSHRTYASYVEELNSYGYINWGMDWLPHDGRAKNPQTGKSPQQTLKALGRNCPDDESSIIENLDVESGIKAARQMFARCVFDETNAVLLLNRLGKYRRVINKTTNMPGLPMHDENSHGSDGFRGLALCEHLLTNDTVQIPVDPFRHFRRAG